MLVFLLQKDSQSLDFLRHFRDGGFVGMDFLLMLFDAGGLKSKLLFIFG